MNIESLNIRDRVTLSAVPLSTETQKSDKPSASFDDVLQAAFQNVDHLQTEANQAIQRLTVDGSVNIHQAMIAMEKADLSFRLMTQIRNKLIEAYQEVMRMPV
jgi:flagellar hook-basal body complex protein FliE